MNYVCYEYRGEKDKSILCPDKIILGKHKKRMKELTFYYVVGAIDSRNFHKC